MTERPGRRGEMHVLLVFVFLLGIAVGGTGTPAARGQASKPRIRITEVTPTLVPGDTLRLSVTVDDPPTGDLLVSFRFGRRLATRSQFRESITTKIVANHVISVALGGETDMSAAIEPVVTKSGRPDDDRIVLPSEGVYPVEIVLHRPGSSERLARTSTYAIRVGEASRPLDFAWVWPFHTSPPDTPDSEEGGLQAGPELDRLAELAGLAAGVPGTVTLAPATDTLGRLARSSGPEGSAVVETLRRPETNEFLTLGYAGLAGDAWTALDLAILGDQVEAGRDGLEKLLARPVRRDLRVLGGPNVSEAAVAAARDTGATHVLLDPEAVSVKKLKFSLARPFSIEGVDGVWGLRSDPYLAEDLEREGSPTGTAQLLLADLSMIYFDAPDMVRGPILLAPVDWDPPSDLVQDVFARIQRSPHVRLSGLSAVAAAEPTTQGGVAVDLPLENPGATPTMERARGYEAIDAAGAELRLLESLVVDGHGEVEGWSEDLRTAPDTSLVGTDEGRAYPARVKEGTSAALSAVQVQPVEDVRLTSREADLPVTIQNETGMTLRLLLTLESPTVRFPEGNSRVVEVPPRVVTEEFPVEVSGPGPHRVTMRVTSPDRLHTFAESRIRVRSTAANRVALVLTFGSLAFLALWWVVHTMRRRRGRHGGSPQEVWARHETEEPRLSSLRSSESASSTDAEDSGERTGAGRVGVPGGT